MFSVAPKVLFYFLNVFTLDPVLKSDPSGPLSHVYWIPPYGFPSCPGNRFLIRIVGGIQDSLSWFSKSKAYDSGFHEQKFPGLRNQDLPYMRRNT